MTTTTALKRHIRGQTRKHPTLAKFMIPVLSRLCLSPSRALKRDQKIGIHHLETQVLTRTPRRGVTMVARILMLISQRMIKATKIMSLAPLLRAILNPALEKYDFPLPAKCGLFYSQDSPREGLDVDCRRVRRTQ